MASLASPLNVKPVYDPNTYKEPFGVFALAMVRIYNSSNNIEFSKFLATEILT
jgi:hypothetical protein